MRGAGDAGSLSADGVGAGYPEGVDGPGLGASAGPGRADGRGLRGAAGAVARPLAGLGRWSPRGAGRAGPADRRDAVRALAEELEAGAAPADAWRRAGELAGAERALFRAAAALIADGRPIDAAFAGDSSASQSLSPSPVPGAELAPARAPGRVGVGDPALRRPDPELRRLAAVWACSAESGAASAEVLRRWVEDADARERARRAQSVELAGPRASALMLAALPVLGLVLGVAMGADPIGALTGSVAGAALGVVGIALDLCGVAWMLRIIAAAAR
ncbi:MAG: type II secretion system F family protein [Frankiaceae bacterium]|nr:type II secretion system F family protein [Frankiaceae bacterium]